MTSLPASFLTRPITHRAYHDRAAGRIENSRAAIRAAIAAGYGIEIDVQPSADGTAMVFHDYHLDRLTEGRGAIRDYRAADLADIRLSGMDEGIPTLDEVLALVAGAAPLLIEVKDQDSALGPDVGQLEQAVAAALTGYDGDVALMSFNPHSVAALAKAAPGRPRGITTCAYDPQHWPKVPEARRQELRDIPDYGRVGATFISHEATDLERPRVLDLKAAGAGILCWTIRSPEAEAKARRIADNITFEGFAAPLPCA